MGLHEATNQLKQMAIIRGVFRLLAGSGSAYTPVLFSYTHCFSGCHFVTQLGSQQVLCIAGSKVLRSHTHHNQSKYCYLFFKFHDNSCQGSFTNYVYKTRCVGSPNLLTYLYKVGNDNRGG